MIALLRHGDIRAFLRYAIVGVTLNASIYGVTLVLLWLKFAAWQALMLVYPVAVALSFAMNRAWSFGDRNQSPRQFRNYVLVYVIVYPLAIAFTWAQEHAGVPSWFASLITMGLAALAIFFALNFWVFEKKQGTTSV